MHVNAVTLVGRLAEHTSRRSLPAGGEVVSWRLIVDRPRVGGGRRTVDTIRCATFDQRLGESTAFWRRGDLIKVHGSVRRRFWRTNPARAGLYEVEIYEAGRVELTSPDQNGAFPGSTPGPSP
jgi:single-strand DNA-binding protein